MKKILSKSLGDTEKIAAEWLASLPKKDNEALVVGLSGNLGSGKTTFIQAVARGLGVKENVTSPTFVIEKIYKTNNKEFPWLVHIDAYRIESAREMEVLGFEELVEDPNNLILIEWPENVKEILPESALTIKCEFVSENEREFTFPATM